MSHYRTQLVSLIASVLLCCVAGCSESGHATSTPNGATPNAQVGTDPSNAGSDSSKTITFGIYQTDKPTEMFRKFRPMAEHLGISLTTLLDRPISVELKILPSYEEGLDAIVNGTVDFMRLGPASYVLAKERNPDVNLLAMELKKGKKRFKGVIVVRSVSPIKNITDLKGKSFAFGDQNSTIGRYLAQEVLVNAGIHAKDLTFDFLGRHDKVATAVALGRFDAGSCKMSTFKRTNSNNQLRVLTEFDNVTKPWVAKSTMQSEVVDALRDALLETKAEAALASLKASGFSPAGDEDYQLVRDGMKSAESFENLAP